MWNRLPSTVYISNNLTVVSSSSKRDAPGAVFFCAQKPSGLPGSRRGDPGTDRAGVARHERRDHLQLRLPGERCVPVQLPLALFTVSASLAQGQTVLAEFTAKSGNFLNVVQRILKNLNGEDTEVTYQYGE